MKSGYDQFFKSARQASQGARPKSSASSSHSQTQFKVQPRSDEELIRRKMMPSKKKKKNNFSWKLTGFSFLGFFITLYGFQNHEKIEHLLKNIEVGILGPAVAQEKAPTPGSDKVQPITEEAKSESKEVVDNRGDLDHLQKLNDRKSQLDMKEQELARQEEEIQKQRAEIDQRLQELKELRTQISTALDDRVKADDQKVDVLVQMYSNMKPPQAAKIFESMDEDLAVEILGRMKKKNAAEVMNLIKAEKAQVISEKFAGYKRKPTSMPSKTPAPATNNEENSTKN